MSCECGVLVSRARRSSASFAFCFSLRRRAASLIFAAVVYDRYRNSAQLLIADVFQVMKILDLRIRDEIGCRAFERGVVHVSHPLMHFEQVENDHDRSRIACQNDSKFSALLIVSSSSSSYLDPFPGAVSFPWRAATAMR